MKLVLIDTSIWVEHFKRHNEVLAKLLEFDLALTHPMVITELACGTPPTPRATTLNDIEQLRSVQQASLREVREFIEREQLYGLGCGLVDMVLLTSTLMTPNAHLWTGDKRLVALSERFGVAYQMLSH